MKTTKVVMAGQTERREAVAMLVPAIHVLISAMADVDTRDIDHEAELRGLARA